jgi:hypothetical protein
VYTCSWTVESERMHIAKVRHTNLPTLTSTSSVHGTEVSMAFEQLRCIDAVYVCMMHYTCTDDAALLFTLTCACIRSPS